MWIRMLLQPLCDRHVDTPTTLVMTKNEELTKQVETALKDTVIDTHAEYGADPYVPIRQPNKDAPVPDGNMPPADLISDSENLVSTVHSLRVASKNKAIGHYITSIRDALVRKQIGALIWIDGQDNPADALTRPGRRQNTRAKQLARAAMGGRMWLPAYETRGTFVRRKQKRPVKKKRDARRDLQSQYDSGEKNRMENIYTTEVKFKHMNE